MLPSSLHTLALHAALPIYPLTASIFPMKVYEYLAAGLPVVATALPALAGVDGVVTAAGAEAVGARLQEALADDTPERRRQRSDRKSTRLNSSHEWRSYAALLPTHSCPPRRSSDLPADRQHLPDDGVRVPRRGAPRRRDGAPGARRGGRRRDRRRCRGGRRPPAGGAGRRHAGAAPPALRSEEHTSQLQSRVAIVCCPPPYTLLPSTPLFRSTR